MTEALEGWNEDGPCRVVVLHLSLLIHCCIDCVFIWRGNGGELMSDKAAVMQAGAGSVANMVRSSTNIRDGGKIAIL